MNNLFYIYYIGKEENQKVIDFSKANHMSVDDAYNNIFWRELNKIESWSNSKIISVMLEDMNIPVKENHYIELSRDTLNTLKDKLIKTLNEKFEINIINRLETSEMVRSAYTEEILTLIKIINGINICLIDTNLDKYIVFFVYAKE